MTTAPSFSDRLVPKLNGLALEFTRQAGGEFQVNGSTGLSELTLGNARFSKLGVPLHFATQADHSLLLTGNKAAASIAIADPTASAPAGAAAAALSGAGQIEVLRATMTNVLTPSRQLVIQPHDLSFGMPKPAVNVTVAGGPLSLGDGPLLFTNERLTADLKNNIQGVLTSNGLPMQLPGLNVVPVISGNSILYRQCYA